MMRTTTTLLLAIVLLASCNQYKKTPSGLSYKITPGDGKVKLKNGTFIKFNIEYTVPPKDSVLSSSYGHIPAFLVIDTTRAAKHSFLEIITQCAVGDKIDFAMSVDTLQKLGMIQYDKVFRARDMIKGRVEILKAYNTQEELIADRMKEVEIEKQREIKEIADYIAKKGIKAQQTKSGAFVEIEAAGDQTAKADSGKMASVMYKGFNLASLNKPPFDTNMDPNGQHKDPLMVLVGSTGGQNSVIPGLDEALRMFGKGGKGKVYIPAMLGYGDAGSPPVIPQYSNLLFEVQVTDVTVAPPPAPTQLPAPAPQPKK